MASTSSRWSVAIYSGASPLSLAPHAAAANPVLTAAEVTDVDACFVADPFMHHDGRRWSMFVEVLNRRRATGEIGLATSSDGLSWSYEGIVLAEPFHLSYPFVLEHGGEYFLLPETGEAAQVRLYRATRFPFDWTLDTVLLDGERIVDASLLLHGGRWWMFGCGTPKGHDLLRLWMAEDVRGPWREHPRSPIVAGDNRLGRPAGRPVASGGRVYRFAQDCASDYGSSVRAVEITRLTESDYAEREATPEPVLRAGTHPWNARRTHHVDAHRHNGGWIACVDGDRFAEAR